MEIQSRYWSPNKVRGVSAIAGGPAWAIQDYGGKACQPCVRAAWNEAWESEQSKEDIPTKERPRWECQMHGRAQTE
jgi:hypothetical protein